MLQAGIQSRRMLMYDEACSEMSFVDSGEQNEFATNELGLDVDRDFESWLTSWSATSQLAY